MIDQLVVDIRPLGNASWVVSDGKKPPFLEAFFRSSIYFDNFSGVLRHPNEGIPSAYEKYLMIGFTGDICKNAPELPCLPFFFNKNAGPCLLQPGHTVEILSVHPLLVRGQKNIWSARIFGDNLLKFPNALSPRQIQRIDFLSLQRYNRIANPIVDSSFTIRL